MGNSKSKKSQKEPDKFFEREKLREMKREEKRKKNANPSNKRVGMKETPVPPSAPPAPPPGAAPAPAPAHVRSYNDEALDIMRYQLHNDSDAFLLNNILLSVQFFENYEREIHHIRNNPVSEWEHMIEEAMVQRHKHVFFADRMAESVHEHVSYQRRRDHTEPLVDPRLYVIYDNVEASEPGDTSDYSAVLDAPFYKLRIEDCKEPGYLKLKKLEVLESALTKELETTKTANLDSDDSIYSDSERESNYSDDSPSVAKGTELLEKIKFKLDKSAKKEPIINEVSFKNNLKVIDTSSRRGSGPVKQFSLQVTKGDISNMKAIRNMNQALAEEDDDGEQKTDHAHEEKNELKPRKSILKMPRRLSGPVKDMYQSRIEITKITLENSISEDTETSGYRSNSSSRQNELSESESDYGYSTITESTTPKRIVLSEKTNYPQNSGVLPEECWSQIQVKAMDNWSDDDEEVEVDDTASKLSLSRNLYEKHFYLSSLRFMKNFVDNFIIDLGSGLGLNQNAINTAMTQGASVYCNTTKNGRRIAYEVFPALIAAWPNAANQWIIRERRIIQNPRTNLCYQWPTKYMVSKAIGFGCLLVPVGFRPKRGVNTEGILQWRITFPAAERYLEGSLAHSHIRCYYFALILHKTFMENETSKIGIDASHIKNHLFWQCENNYARWPEDRLGETLRMFLQSFYVHFAKSRFPNYFVESCNDFKSIPKPLLLQLQKKLAKVLESPVIHLLKAIDKLKYSKKEFYPIFNAYRLYEVLTCRNPLRILNPNIPLMVQPNQYSDESDSEDEKDSHLDFWSRNRAYDKHYQWKKEKQRQIKERRKAQLYNKQQKTSQKNERIFNENIILPQRMDRERRRIVLEFFIPHFIAMARSSERFEAINQAIIYLEQAQRLNILLMDEPGGDMTASEFGNVILDKLADCQRKLVNQGGFHLPPRKDSQLDRQSHPRAFRKQRPRYDQIVNQDSPTDSPGISAFTFTADIHEEAGEESKL